MASLFFAAGAILVAYLVGSIPFALIASRLFGLADPRSYGSGNPGATNVLRSGNKAAAVFTLLGDALKGAVVVLLARTLGEDFGLSQAQIALVVLAVFFGHLYPVFLKFRGGKGVATAAGVLLAIAPFLGLATLGVWLFVFITLRYSSLAALLAAVAAPFFAFLFLGGDVMLAVVGVMSIALIGRHWQNLQRLMAGTEPRVGKHKKG